MYMHKVNELIRMFDHNKILNHIYYLEIKQHYKHCKLQTLKQKYFNAVSLIQAW